MKGYIRQVLLLAIFAIGGGYAIAGLDSMFAQSKDLAATAPKTIDIPFSPSDAVEINKLRLLREDTDRKIAEILTSYGGEGEVLLDAKGNYIGIRKPTPKEAKKP